MEEEISLWRLGRATSVDVVKRNRPPSSGEVPFGVHTSIHTSTSWSKRRGREATTLARLTRLLPASVTPDRTRGGNYQLEIRSDVPSQSVRGGTEPTIVLQIAPTVNPDNAFRLVPIVVVFSPCEREAGFFSLFFFVKCPGVHGVIAALRCVRPCSRSRYRYRFLRHDARPK